MRNKLITARRNCMAPPPPPPLINKQRYIEANGGSFEGIEHRNGAVLEAVNISNQTKFKWVPLLPCTFARVIVLADGGGHPWRGSTTAAGCRGELQLARIAATLLTAPSSASTLVSQPSASQTDTMPASDDGKTCVICLEAAATATVTHGSTVRGLSAAA
jgi:hypothetical protein